MTNSGKKMLLVVCVACSAPVTHVQVRVTVQHVQLSARDVTELLNAVAAHRLESYLPAPLARRQGGGTHVQGALSQDDAVRKCLSLISSIPIN